MRKLVIAVMAMLVPFTAWTAGCRQDSRQAAFPAGPEVKSLARAATVEDAQPTIPMIPAPIDREIMQSPDQSTFARIRSVRDREEQLAGQFADAPGLFVLPAEENDLASLMGPVMTPPSPAMPMSSPIYEPLRVIPIGNPVEEPLPEPIPASALASAPATAPSPMTEFWSRPTTPMTSAYGFMPPPVDVSAMAPSAWDTPEAHPPASAPKPNIDADPMFMPETIPGIFTIGEEGPTAFIAPKSISKPAGDDNPPLFLSSAGALPAQVARFSPQGPPSPPPPTLAALAALSGRAAPRKVELSDKIASLLNDDPGRALAPLTPLGGKKTTAMAMPEVKPLEKAEPPTRDGTASVSSSVFDFREDMNPSAEIFMPSPPAAGARGGETHDMYRMDFREDRIARKIPKLEPFDFETPKTIPEFPPRAGSVPGAKVEGIAAKEPVAAVPPTIPELSAPAPETGGAAGWRAPVAVPAGEAPQKVTFVPGKPAPARVLGLEKIDSAIDAPPLKF